MRYGLNLYSTLIVSLLVLIFTSCHKDSTTPLDAKSLEINQFIWSSMQEDYLWTDSVTNLTKFQPNSAALKSFLYGYSDHEKLFNALLYPKRDKWSWIVDDYVALENMFQGLSKTMGFEFGLAYTDKSHTTIFGFVQYVDKGSPADLAGIKRGDLFNEINNTVLTVSNYQTLLNQDTYTLSFFAIINNTFISLNKQTTITAIEFQVNPILMDTVFTTAGGIKVGYLLYNQFESNYDIALNNVFNYFKGEGVTQVVLDLRYNGGGSVQSAIYLAGMIYNTLPSAVILKTQYNKTVEAEILSAKGSDYFNEYFTNTIAATSTTPATPITSLGLKNLYVLTSGNTASASELIINALRAYIPVKTIGTTTVGKYVASVTIKDYLSNGAINPDHKWALQPIVLKIANKDGMSDFVNGFSPDILVDEFQYVDKLTRLGSSQEPLLSAALNDIQGNAPVKSIPFHFYDRIGDSKDLKPHAKEMFINHEFLMKR